MNRLLWRVFKLVAVLFGLYLFLVPVIYYYSQSKQQLPPLAPIVKGGPKVEFEEKPVVLTRNIVPSVEKGDIFAKNGSRLKNEVHVSDEAGESGETNSGVTSVDTLMMKPQQQYDFHHGKSMEIWPSLDHPEDDRIIAQMKYKLVDQNPANKKTIMVYTGLRDGMLAGQQSFINQKCPVTNCDLTSNRDAAATADAILWQNHVSLPSVSRPTGQIWMVFFLESPYHTPSLHRLDGLVNWTATYRRDSTIVAPYERFTLFNSSVTQLPLAKNYAKGKTKKVAWFVSNCGTRNNRLQYAKELSKYIEVDIYGACGSLSCPRSQTDSCFNKLNKDYKFYLSFENSNCKDYITEKFFVNGLENDVLPIVMGAHPDDYKHSAPYHSYIHVDDFESPEKLAEYLHELDNNDDQYNEYFRWKGTGHNLNTYFWCRICAMVHAADQVKPSVYKNVEDWWRGPHVCKAIGSGYIWPKWDA